MIKLTIRVYAISEFTRRSRYIYICIWEKRNIKICCTMCAGHLWNFETLLALSDLRFSWIRAMQRRENNCRLRMTTAAWLILYFSYLRRRYQTERSEGKREMLSITAVWKLIWRFDIRHGKAQMSRYMFQWRRCGIYYSRTRGMCQLYNHMHLLYLTDDKMIIY